jgi:hypothetical protein
VVGRLESCFGLTFYVIGMADVLGVPLIRARYGIRRRDRHVLERRARFIKTIIRIHHEETGSLGPFCQRVPGET